MPGLPPIVEDSQVSHRNLMTVR